MNRLCPAFAAACLFAAAVPVLSAQCTQITDTLGALGTATPGLMTGTIDIALSGTIVQGDSTTVQSTARITVAAGIVSICLPGATPAIAYTATYTVKRPAPMSGTATFTRYWAVPSTGPVTVAAIETPTPITPAITPLPLSLLAPNLGDLYPIVFNSGTGIISCPTCLNSGGGLTLASLTNSYLLSLGNPQLAPLVNGPGGSGGGGGSGGTIQATTDLIQGDGAGNGLDSGIVPASVIVSSSSYANPSWITTFAWGKLTGTPTFLTPANNLSDLASAATARTNLGLGTAATQATSAFDAAGAATAAQVAAIAASLQRASNLSDLSSTATARTNLGLGPAALLNVWGSGSRLVAATALGVAGNCADWTAAGLGDTGSPCGSGGGGGANALGFYLVDQATNAPANAVNLGALSTGLVDVTVAAGVATPGTLSGTAFQPVMANASVGAPSATSTATLGAIVDGDCADVTPFTLTGAALGDVVFAGVSVALPAGVHATAKVTATNTVSVEVCNLSESAQTINSATYKVALLR